MTTGLERSLDRNLQWGTPFRRWQLNLLLLVGFRVDPGSKLWFDLRRVFNSILKSGEEVVNPCVDTDTHEIKVCRKVTSKR